MDGPYSPHNQAHANEQNAQAAENQYSFKAKIEAAQKEREAKQLEQDRSPQGRRMARALDDIEKLRLRLAKLEALIQGNIDAAAAGYTPRDITYLGDDGHAYEQTFLGNDPVDLGTDPLKAIIQGLLDAATISGTCAEGGGIDITITL